ncbi:MAG TPA: AMP-binding protein, partial [Actinomycetes bacterium]
MNCTLAIEVLDVRDDDVMLGTPALPRLRALHDHADTGADAVLETIQRHRVSQFAGVPTMLIALLHADTTGFDLTSLRVANSGGPALPSEVLLGIERKFPNLTILEGYGMSETASGAACNRRNSRKPHSVGKPVWGVQMRV